MIVETIVSTTDENCKVNLSPIGAVVQPASWDTFEFRLFPGSQTLTNLQQNSEGVLHLTDNPMLFARAIANQWDESPLMKPSNIVKVQQLVHVQMAIEFRVVSSEAVGERIFLQCETVATHRGIDYRGFNRAGFAIVEAAILISRLGILPLDNIESQLKPLEIIVQKTGGPIELAAWLLLAERMKLETSR